MAKEYRRTIYWVNTKTLCGAVAVDQNGEVFKWDTAPCYRWMTDKKFTKVLNILKYKKILISCKRIDKDVDPF